MTIDADAVRRVVWTLAVYGLVAAVLLWAVPSIQRLFLLPPLFARAVKLALVLAIPVVAALAWRYPSVGDSDRPR